VISKKVQDALNGQINAELYSEYMYLSMSAWFESENLKGMAHWMALQAQEEHAHAMKFFKFIIERGGQVALKAIDAPPAQWDSPLAAFQAVSEHEQKVTGLINKLADLAEKEGDRATAVLLQWFITEQVEEEASAAQIVRNLEMIGEQTGPLFMFDSVLGQRGK